MLLHNFFDPRVLFHIFLFFLHVFYTIIKKSSQHHETAEKHYCVENIRSVNLKSCVVNLCLDNSGVLLGMECTKTWIVSAGMLYSVTATEHPVNLAFYPVPFCRGLPRDAQLGSSLGFGPASPRPLHQRAPSNHTLSSLCGKGHCLVGRQMPAPHHKGSLQREASGF